MISSLEDQVERFQVERDEAIKRAEVAEKRQETEAGAGSILIEAAGRRAESAEQKLAQLQAAHRADLERVADEIAGWEISDEVSVGRETRDDLVRRLRSLSTKDTVACRA